MIKHCINNSLNHTLHTSHLHNRSKELIIRSSITLVVEVTYNTVVRGIDTHSGGRLVKLVHFIMLVGARGRRVFRQWVKHSRK